MMKIPVVREISSADECLIVALLLLFHLFLFFLLLDALLAKFDDDPVSGFEHQVLGVQVDFRPHFEIFVGVGSCRRHHAHLRNLRNLRRR